MGRRADESHGTSSNVLETDSVLRPQELVETPPATPAPQEKDRCFLSSWLTGPWVAPTCWDFVASENVSTIFWLHKPASKSPTISDGAIMS